MHSAHYKCFILCSFFLYSVIHIMPASAQLAGECATLCNDLRFEVLTMEMCRYTYALNLQSLQTTCLKVSRLILLCSDIGFHLDYILYYNEGKQSELCLDQRWATSALPRWNRHSQMRV